MTNKEQIIINGKKQYCKILFRCKHIDDTAAYDMMCEGIEIKPENAPVSDFELMLIENTNSPFGFSLVCKRNNKEDVWEHSGFGNSGACSIVTALLKQLTCKSQECEELKERASIAEDNFACEVQARLYHQNEWLKFSKECEKLKKQLKTSEKWRINAESLNEKLDIKNTLYRKALEEIEEYAKENEEMLQGYHHEWANNRQILEIINKAKGEGDENT